MYSTVERVDDCEYSVKIIIVPLKEGIAGTTYFWKETYYYWKNHSNNGWLQVLLLK